MKVLVAVDLADAPEALVDAASVWASRTGGTLSVLYVEELGEAWSVGVSDPTVISLLETEREALRARHRQRVETLLERVPEPQRGEALIKGGVAWSAIVEAAVDHDLVIVATHGRTGLAHFFLGSVAERVVRASPKPVLVLRPKKQES